VAELINEKWRLAVLGVQLELSAREPTVLLELVGYRIGEARPFWRQRYPLSSFMSGTTPPDSFSVPSDLPEHVAMILRHQIKDQAAVWLRLVPPYGYLGAVPWEEAIIEATDLPLMRVPDRLPIPAPLGQTSRVAVIFCAMSKFTRAASRLRGFSSASYLRAFTKNLLAVSGPTQVDIFADARTVQALARRGIPEWVSVHGPKKAAVSRSTPVGGLTEWITSGLSGNAASALHVVLDADFDLDSPLLAVQSDPNHANLRSSRVLVTADTLTALADAIGADILSVGSPPGNPADSATRMIADQIGRQRAGVTMYTSVERDPHGAALATAYAFASDQSGEARIPRSTSLFTYLPPGYIQNSLRRPWPTQMPELLESTHLPAYGQLESRRADFALQTRYPGTSSVPSWVAASDRYIDTQWADLLGQASTPFPTTNLTDSDNQGAAEGLEVLREIVDRHASPE
jgi:hypothetical protein